jgi:hypothetical protein
MFGKKIKRTLCACLLGLGLLGGGLATGPAWAGEGGDTKVLEILDDDGTVFAFYKDSAGGYYCIIHEVDGTAKYADISSNPSPDDPNDGRGTYIPSYEDMLKKVRDAYTVGKNVEDTPLGGMLNRHGQGFKPVGNPGDADGWDRGPGTPLDHSGDGKKTPQQMREMLIADNLDAKARFNMVGGMSGYGDSGEEAPGPNNHGKSNTRNDDDASGEDKQNNTLGDTYDLGPRPDLINPNPDGPTTAAP